MRKTLTFGLIGAAMSIGACHHTNLSTAQQERTRMNESGSETAQAGRETGRNAAEAARNAGSGVVHGVEAAGHGAVAGVNYVEHGVARNDTQHLQQAHRQTERMDSQADTSGQRFRQSGGETVATGRAAGNTVIHAGETGVNATEHGIGTVRRAAGERPHGTQRVRGGGPNAASINENQTVKVPNYDPSTARPTNK